MRVMMLKGCHMRNTRWRVTTMLLATVLVFVVLSKMAMPDVSLIQFSMRPRDLTRYAQLKACSMSLVKTYNVQCSALLQGDAAMHARVKQSKWKRQFDRLTPACTLSHLAEDCESLAAMHGYNSWPVTPQEEEFPIAFGIRMHTAAEQAEQLLRTIYRPHNFYCIHVDAAAYNETVYEPLRKIGRCFPNVHVLSDRLQSVYSSIRLVQAEMACIRAALASNITWRYYLPMTGQEFPLKTNAELVAVLRLLNGTNDIESYPVPSIVAFRYKNRHEIKGRSLRKTKTLNPPPPGNVTLRKGSAYGSFSRDFLVWFQNDTFVKEFVGWLEHTFAPEEFVWSTLNSLPDAPGGYSVVTSHGARTHLSRAVIWGQDKDKCRGSFIRAVCVFSTADLPWLLSQPQLIANKFDRRKDQVILDCLEETLRARAKAQDFTSLQWSYYLNLPYVKTMI